MCCITIEHKAVATILNILEKFYQLPILGILNMSDQLVENWRLSACQKIPPFLTFLRYCKDITDLLRWVNWECLIMPINIDNINLVWNFNAQSSEINF